MLSEAQKDALQEYMSLYIGQAASLLSDMIEKRVKLTIPDIQLIDQSTNRDQKIQFLSSLLDSYIVSSSIGFGTEFSGEAKLIFPKQKVKALISLCMGNDSFEDLNEDLTDTDFDGIREIGNIILNAIVGSLGNLVNVRLDYTLPDVNVLFLTDELDQLKAKTNSYLLVIKNVFTIEEANIEGAIIVILNIEAINKIFAKIDEIMREIYE